LANPEIQGKDNRAKGQREGEGRGKGEGEQQKQRQRQRQRQRQKQYEPPPTVERIRKEKGNRTELCQSITKSPRNLFMDESLYVIGLNAYMIKLITHDLLIL